jgi:hypothetical protein
MLRTLLGTAAAGALGLEFLHTHRNWGAAPDEVAAVLPGDELVPDPAEQTTLAVSVDAPADEVWAWLVQIGQDRGGMYSYDALENLIGLDIHSTDEIREEWQHLAVGDRVVVVPEGYGPMPAGYSFAVARVDAGAARQPVERRVVLPRSADRGRRLPARLAVPHRASGTAGTATRDPSG